MKGWAVANPSFPMISAIGLPSTSAGDLPSMSAYARLMNTYRRSRLHRVSMNGVSLIIR